MKFLHSSRAAKEQCAIERKSCVSFLKRYAYPYRYSDMIPIFGRPVPEFCTITNKVTDWVYENHGRHRLTEWNDTVLNAAALRRYADAVARKGAALTNCFGFVDGTVRPISRPGQHQRIVYNGQWA